MDLSNASAIVTGGASGLGLATARRLAARGAHLVLLDLPGSAGAAVAGELGGKTSFAAADVTDADAVADAVDTARGQAPLRAVVHCAGRGGTVRVLARDGSPGPLELFETVLRVNVIGTWNVLRLAAAAMAGNEPQDGDRGAFVLTASVAAWEGQIGQMPYAASKAGIVGMTLVAARDLARRQIRVCTIAPGVFDTPILARFSQEIKQGLAASVPHPSRLGHPDEFARLAEHILDNPMLNGETIRLDGAIQDVRAMTGTDKVLVERDEGVMTITINRSEVRNAIDEETARGLAAALEELDPDPALGAAVLTGAGGTFCSGMDLKAFLAGERPSVEGRGFAGLAERPPAKPIIAAVEGAAVAGGFELVLACDLVVAAEDARFGLPEVKRGLVAAGGGLLRLPRRVPYHLAMEWALTGEYITAERAAQVGLVNRLVAPGTAAAQAAGLARAIAANGPLAVAATKRIIVESTDWLRAEQFARQRAISEPVRASEDAREGALAFREKRAPRWQGR